MIDFRTAPERYKHWSIDIEAPIATLSMDVDETASLVPGYELKLNSYDLGVDIELYDAIQRLRFEHPEVRTVVIASGNEKVFCSGANIRMLGLSAHGHKVNFCKFTNETRNAIEDASEFSGQRYLCAINGTAAGGGYELAAAADYLVLVDDGNAAVSLPEVPLLAVLPGTGGLTRLVDKRKVRRDLADVFCTLEEGVRGQRAVDWRLVDETVAPTSFDSRIQEKAIQMAESSDRPGDANGVSFTPLNRDIDDDSIRYPFVTAQLDRAGRVATIMLEDPAANPPSDVTGIEDTGVDFWPLALARSLDDLLLHLRFNEPELGTLVFKTKGDGDAINAYDQLLRDNQDHWLVREILLYWKRTLKRVDYTSRSTFAMIEPGSCFAGLLAEILFSVDRSYMLEGQFEDNERPPAAIQLTESNFGLFPMGNDLTRLETRFLGEPDTLANARQSHWLQAGCSSRRTGCRP